MERILHELRAICLQWWDVRLSTFVVSFYDKFGLILNVRNIWRLKALKLPNFDHHTVIDASSYCQKLQSLANIIVADNMGVSSSVFAQLSPKARQKKNLVKPITGMPTRHSIRLNDNIGFNSKGPKIWRPKLLKIAGFDHHTVVWGPFATEPPSTVAQPGSDLGEGPTIEHFTKAEEN